MTLTIADLEEAIIALRYAADGGVFVTGDRLFVEALKPLVAELSRRAHGPFTLAEAVASGRPFREIGGNPEYCEAAFPSRYYCNHCEIETSADKMMWLARKSDGGHWASFYDIDAGKYELMPEGGE